MNMDVWIPWYWGFPILAVEVLVLYYVNKVIERKLDEREEHELRKLDHYWRDQS